MANVCSLVIVHTYMIVQIIGIGYRNATRVRGAVLGFKHQTGSNISACNGNVRIDNTYIVVFTVNRCGCRGKSCGRKGADENQGQNKSKDFLADFFIILSSNDFLQITGAGVRRSLPSGSGRAQRIRQWRSRRVMLLPLPAIKW